MVVDTGEGVVVEAKNVTKISLPMWKIEILNLMVCHKLSQ